MFDRVPLVGHASEAVEDEACDSLELLGSRTRAALGRSSATIASTLWSASENIAISEEEKNPERAMSTAIVALPPSVIVRVVSSTPNCNGT